MFENAKINFEPFLCILAMANHSFFKDLYDFSPNVYRNNKYLRTRQTHKYMCTIFSPGVCTSKEALRRTAGNSATSHGLQHESAVEQQKSKVLSFQIISNHIHFIISV
jgi:hypothetical protein